MSYRRKAFILRTVVRQQCIQGLHVSDNVVLGAGAVVVKNIDESGIYAGVLSGR